MCVWGGGDVPVVLFCGCCNVQQKRLAWRRFEYFTKLHVSNYWLLADYQNMIQVSLVYGEHWSGIHRREPYSCSERVLYQAIKLCI